MIKFAKVFFVLFITLANTSSFASVCYGKFYHKSNPGQAETYCAIDIGSQECAALVANYADIFKKKDPDYYFVKYSWIGIDSFGVHCAPFPQ